MTEAAASVSDGFVSVRNTEQGMSLAAGRVAGLYCRIGVGLLGVGILVGGCDREGATGGGPATSATTTPSRVEIASSEWPAFHGGGALVGVAAPIGGRPLKVRWTFKAGDGDSAPIIGSAAIVGGVVYVADGNGGLHAVDLASGHPKWEYKSDGAFETTPLVYEGKVMLGDNSGTFHCVRADDGKKAWTFDGEGEIHSSANAWGKGPGARVVFGSYSTNVYCLKVADGSRVWQQSAGDKVNGAPAVALGAAFVGGCDAHLHAMALEDGAEKFTADAGGICPASPAIAGDRIVVGTDNGVVLCFSPDGSKRLWSYEGVENQASIGSSPAVGDGVVVVGAKDRQVHALDLATGTRKWVYPTRGDVDSSPAISGGRVYVGSRDKKLYVLDLQTGKHLGEFDAGHPIAASPAVGEGVVVIGDVAGNVYCLEPK
jgi:outer membrane protein assembly factor BamB